MQVPEGPGEEHRCPGPHAGPLPHPHTWVERQAPVPASAVQLTQTLPVFPQAVSAMPTSQVAPLQQPPGHEVASQIQTPLLQRWPVAHGPPLVPHWHAPVLVQAFERASQLPQATPFNPH